MVRRWHLAVVGLAVLGHAVVSGAEGDIPGIERVRLTSIKSFDRIFTDLRHQRLGIVRGGARHVWVDGEVVSLSAGRATHALFSPNARRTAWVACQVRQPRHAHVAVDGEEGPAYDAVDSQCLVFSPDSERVGYAAVRDERWHFVVDDSEGPEHDAILATGHFFSPDGRRTAYVGMKEAEAVKFHKFLKRSHVQDRAQGIFSIWDGFRVWRIEHPKCVVVVDGSEGADFDDILPGSPAFSPDGEHVAYGGKEEGKWVLVLDGDRMAEWDEIGDHSITFSPGSSQIAYTARTADRWAVMVDDARGPEYDAIGVGPPVFSRDGERVAYAAQKDGQWRLVINGNEGPEYDDIMVGQSAFGPDGSRTAFAAKSDGKWRMVVDGVPGPEWNGILPGSPVFSPDGRRIAYGARLESEKWHMIVDHEEVGSPIIGLPQFCEDGSLRFLTVEGAMIGSPDPARVVGIGGAVMPILGIVAVLFEVIGGSKARAVHAVTVSALP